MGKPDLGQLTKKKCKPCEGGAKPLDHKSVQEYLARLSGLGLSEDAESIRKEYKFKNFKEVIAFFNKIADIAEEENHHPDLRVSYNRVIAELSTHSIKGLSENDFILAAKFDDVL